MNGWERTKLDHEGRPIYRNRDTGELAAEVVQEARLVDLPPHVAVSLQQALHLAELTQRLRGSSGLAQ